MIPHRSGHDGTPGPADEPATPRAARRRLLLSGAAGALAGALVGGARPVSAGSGTGGQGPLILASNGRYSFEAPSGNQANVASAATVLQASPNFENYANLGGRYVFKADASTAGTTTIDGVQGLAAGDGCGVYGESATGNGVWGVGGIYGVVGRSPVGVGVFGWSGSIGGLFHGFNAAIRLQPQDLRGAPTAFAHDAGELLVDSTGAMYLCKASGTPGTWVRIAEQAPSLHTLPTPERFIDTRSGLGGVQGPAAAGTTSTFQMTGRNGESGNAALRIPDGATILVGNLSVIGGASVPVGSFVTMWPSGNRPTTSSISFGPGAIVANAFTVGLGPSTSGHGVITVFAQQECHYIVDVVGYYA